MAAGVPTIWMGVLPELKGRDISALRAIPCGGSAVPKALSEAYREQIGLPIMQAWGMTETSPVASTGQLKSTLADLPRRRAGRPPDHAGHAARRASSPGSSTPEHPEPWPWDGESRASCRCGGRGSPGSTTTTSARPSRSPTDGWLKTGDVATDRPRRLHPPGRPHQGRGQVGRRVDQLGRAGERDHGPPGVAEAAVIGVAHPQVGRAPAGLRGGQARARRSPRRTSWRSSTAGSPSGGCPTTSSSSTRSPRPRRQVLQEGPARHVRRLRAPRTRTDSEPRHAVGSAVGPYGARPRFLLSPRWLLSHLLVVR